MREEWQFPQVTQNTSSSVACRGLFLKGVGKVPNLAVVGLADPQLSEDSSVMEETIPGLDHPSSPQATPDNGRYPNLIEYRHHIPL